MYGAPRSGNGLRNREQSFVEVYLWISSETTEDGEEVCTSAVLRLRLWRAAEDERRAWPSNAMRDDRAATDDHTSTRTAAAAVC